MTPGRRVAFQVIGDPKPQGSARAFVIGKHARVTNTTTKAASNWRDAVATAAARAAAELDGPLDGPLAVSLQFRFRMPRSRPAALRKLGWAPKATAPDADKLARSCLDAMQAAALISDDARVCDLAVVKHEWLEGWTGCNVIVAEVPVP